MSLSGFMNYCRNCRIPDSRSKKTLATKFEVCYIIGIKRAAAHKGLTDNEDSNATHLPTKVSGWLLLCKPVLPLT